MAKYKITYDKDICIGILACVAVDDELWVPCDGEAKVDLKDAVLNEKTGKYELIIERDRYPLAKEASEVCPVDAIQVEKIED